MIILGELLIKERQIVIPGEELARGMDFLPSIGTLREGESIYSTKLGLASIKEHLIKIIPLKGKYLPIREDIVIGIIKDVGLSGWSVDINMPTNANLPIGEAVRDRVEILKTDISKYFDIDDIIVAKVLNVSKSRIVQLSMKDYGLRKLRGGKILKLSPSKVPRLIGKKGSMVSMIKEYTKCEIYVGQNGYIWINGDIKNMYLVEQAINLIEQEAHMSGLTDKIKNLLEKNKILKGDSNE